MSYRSLIEEYVEMIWNLGFYDCIRDYIHEEYTSVGFNGTTKGPDELVRAIKKFKSNFSSLTLMVKDVVTEGNKVGAFIIASGEQHGVPWNAGAADLWEMKDGKICYCPMVVIQEMQ